MHQKVAMEGVRVMKNSTQDPGKDTNKIRSSNAKNSEEAGHSGNFLHNFNIVNQLNVQASVNGGMGAKSREWTLCDS